MNLVRPSMHHILLLADHAPAEEIAQHEAFTGIEWDAGAVAARYYRGIGHKFALLDVANMPVAAGGWEPEGNGTWSSWMITGPDAWREHGLALTRHCRDVMDTLFHAGARRLELQVLATRTGARDWYVKGLRMTEEGTRRQYGANGEDAVMYARVKGD